MMRNQENHELGKSIENLYNIFYKYSLRENMNYCDCGCISEKDIKNVYSKPLDKLTADDLEKYSHKALTTWGDSYDFRHFFPRLAELVASNNSYLLDCEIILGKLNYGEWHTWDKQEQEVVQNYLIALWEFVLNRNIGEGYTISDSVLCAISQAMENPSPLLNIWENRDDISALQHLHWFIVFNLESIKSQQLINPFWENRPQQMRIIFEWIKSPALKEKIIHKINVVPSKSKRVLKSILKNLE